MAGGCRFFVKVMELVKSPLNYTGNKFRILPQIQPYFPKEIDTMVDLFCGGATVSINTECKNRICIDNNDKVIGLLEYLSESQFEKIKTKIFGVAQQYNLSNSFVNGFKYYKNLCKDKNDNNGLRNYNEVGYYELREDYNSLNNKSTDKAYLMLYILMLYSFNNDIRFSNEGRFNLPVGKTDINKSNLDKLKIYINRMSEIKCRFVCEDFKSKAVRRYIDRSDFIYLDPPYLITTAVYNDAGKWDEIDESELIKILEEMIKNKKYFVLSNLLDKKDKINIQLKEFIKKYKNKVRVKNINYNYKSASYNKIIRDSNEHEIIVISKGKK